MLIRINKNAECYENERYRKEFYFDLFSAIEDLSF